ncbi:hypothetical protein F8O07_06965 [Pseudoclavibacter sp. CFCC 13796]|uniref:hypothetical protein n=1 Tax=Pseudoclavibacter sp. CFCC 13796 TaxID=2615179 RepID=UPI001300E7DA|nr:hypothetical protein [Pseudoclavibacter sp. CFCC 13796]KAB1661640.1 hypothetical protein F8O07_06965 [Pseudoclavibacter sp. CFCC 13796]
MRTSDVTLENPGNQVGLAIMQLERKVPAGSVPVGTETEVDGERFRVVRRGVAGEFVLALSVILLTALLVGVLQTMVWAAPLMISKVLFALASAAIGIVLVATIARRPVLGTNVWGHIVGLPTDSASKTAPAHTAEHDQ